MTTDSASTTATAAKPVSRRRSLIYYGYWLVGVALIAQFVSAGSQNYVAGVFLKPMTEELDWTRAEFAYANTLGRFVVAFLGVFIGGYVDRGSGRPLMVVGVTILGAGLFLTSAVTELWQWVLVRGVMFAAGAAMISNLVVNVTLSKWFVEKRGRVIGVAAMGVSLGGVIMAPAMTAFTGEFGWRAGWMALGVMAWVLVYPASMLMRGAPEQYGLNPDGRSDEEMASAAGARIREDTAASLTRAEALRTPALYVLVAAFGLGTIGLGTMILHTIPFSTDAGYNSTTAALMLTVLATPAAFSKPLWGWAADHIPPRVLAAISFLISATAMVIIVFGAKSGQTIPLGAGFFLVGLGIGGQIPIRELIWATYFGRRHLGAIRGVAMPLTLFFGAGGPLAVAVYFDVAGNYDGAFLGVAVLWVLAALLVLAVPRPRRLERARMEPPDDGDGRMPGNGAAPQAVTEGAAAAAAGANGDTGGVSPDPDAPLAPPAVATPVAAPRRVRPRYPLRDYMEDGNER